MIDVFGIFIAVSFISLIVTLVVMNTIKRIKKAQELFDTGKIPPTVGLKFNTSPPNKSATCASNETPPDHKTRVALRKKRKSKQGK